MSTEFHWNGPWELPEGWVWARLGDVSEVNPGTSFDDLPDGVQIPFAPMAAMAEETGVVDLSQQRPVSQVKKGYTRFRTNDVLFAKITPCMENGKSAAVIDLPSGYGAGSTEFHVIRSQILYPRFLWYWVVRRAFRGDAQRNMSGSAGQMRVPVDYLRSTPIVIPPLAEQRRIVARIDELFTDIADGESALTRARDDLDTWRRALLKAAFTGELTRQWRERGPSGETGHDIVNRLCGARGEFGHLLEFTERREGDDKLPATWCWARIDELFEVGTGATPLRGERRFYENGTIPWVTSSVVNFPIVLEPAERITHAALRETNCKVFPVGTLLVAMYGEGKTRGRATVLGIPAATNQACAALQFPIEDDTLRRYVRYWLEFNYLLLRKQAIGGVQPNLSLGIIRSLELPMPPSSEQSRIIEILDENFEYSSEISAYLKQLAATSSRFRESVFKSAFEGRLVEQDSRDEPAETLLARLNVGETKTAPPSSRRGRRERDIVRVDA